MRRTLLLVAVAVLVAGCGSVGAGSSHGKIAFAAKVDGAWRLVLVDSGDGKSETLPFPDDVVTPVWSPDGRHLAFLLNERLYVLDEDLRNPRSAAPHADYTWSWSPDSQYILFAYDGLSVVRPDGTGLVQIADCGIDCGEPAWSHEGNQIAYFTRQGIKVTGAKDSREKLLARCQEQDCVSPAWAPDGGRIAFGVQARDARARPNGCALRVIPSSAHDTLITEHPPADHTECGDVSWSPDGKVLAAERMKFTKPYTMSLSLYDADDSKRPVRVIEDARFHEWSPDGRHVAFYRMLTSDPTLWVANADGTGARRIGRALEWDWSPDGTELLLAHPLERRLLGRGPVVIWIANAETGEHRRLWPNRGSCDCGDPVWQPD